jgi:hypothetical protein
LSYPITHGELNGGRVEYSGTTPQKKIGGDASLLQENHAILEQRWKALWSCARQ